MEKDLQKFGKGEQKGYVEAKGYLGIGKPPPAKIVMVEEVVQLSAVLDGVNDSALFMHPF